MAQTPTGVGVYTDGKIVSLFYRRGAKLFIDQSQDGLHFEPAQSVAFPNPANMFHARIAKVKSHFAMAFIEKKEKQKPKLRFATAKHLAKWTSAGDAPYISDPGVLVHDFDYQGHMVLYFGGKKLGAAVSQDCKDWRIIGSDILPCPPFSSCIAGDARMVHGDIFFLYFTSEDHTPRYRLFWATFSPHDPAGLRASADTPIWEAPVDWDGEPFGVTVYAGTIISYWNSRKKGMFALSHGPLSAFAGMESKRWNILHRVAHNPILSPIIKHFWESKAVFNPAAVYSRGKVHLIYRAIGDGDVSVLGYANSCDGVHIDERLADPIFVPGLPHHDTDCQEDPPGIYTSGGGGWGGSEDPRIVEIDGRMYMTYVAYDGWGPPRVALTSIGSDDFHNHRWKWDPPVLISPPGIVDKNAVLFPEKIHGKYVMLHRIFPNIYVDFFDDLSFDGKQKWLGLRHAIVPRAYGWDSRKIGAGAPPIKTRDGWLLIYHAVGEADSGRYKMGAMLLDLDDPTKVRYRSHQPILAPDVKYENEGWKSGVAYPCGAAVVGDQLNVYYGGADMVTCVATSNLPHFLDQLKANGAATVQPVPVSMPYRRYD